jgi:hypothetical protein
VDFFNPHTPTINDALPMNPLLPITTLEHLNTLLNRHPYFRDRPSFPKHYWHAQCYLLMKTAQHTNTLPTTSTHHLATTIGINYTVVRYWLRNERTPRLTQSLTTHEHARQHHETTLPHEHHHYRIDPTTTYNAIRSLKEHPHIPENLTNAIKTLYQKVEPKRFLIADLNPYHDAGPQWTRTIAKSIQQHRETVETLLNQHLKISHHPHHELRLAIDNHTLYLWHRNTDPDHWLNLLKHEYFYFDSTNIKQLLINEAKRHLNTTDIGLSRLTQQLTEHKGELTHPNSRLGDHNLNRPYLTGESLHLLLDATGRDFKDIHLFVTRLGRDTHGFEIGGIHNPIFLEGEQRDLFFTRITAIAFSDGHIHHENKQFTYIENEPQRRQYVNTLMKQFGNVYITHDERTGADRLNMPVTIGRLLEQLGVPAGDKHLSPNYRLPEFIRNGSDKIKCAYLSEVIPEDGYFYTHPQIKFGIKRAQILNAGSKAERYDFEPKLSRECVQFIHDYGELRSYSIRSEPIREVKILVWGKLENLTKSEDAYIRETAIQLKKTVEANPCKLLMDEKQLCESLGINIDKKIKEIHLHQSERVSVIWEIQTLETDDTLRWAELAMPSSNPKQAKVKKWLSDREFGEKLRQKHSIDSE